MLLSNKVVIVTGSSTGIGHEIAQLFAQQGANLVLIDVQPPITAENSFDPERTLSVTGDLRDRRVVQNALHMAVQRWGQINVAVNNAGIYPRMDFLSISDAQWQDIHDVNVKSMFFVCQTVLPFMIQHGHGKIVNVASITFHLGVARLAHYVASKGGVIGLTRALAREFGPHNVHVNCIAPGAVLVPSERDFVSEDEVKRFVSQQSLNRRITPLDIARAALFLSCELSDGMTGQTLTVDGGWIMH